MVPIYISHFFLVIVQVCFQALFTFSSGPFQFPIDWLSFQSFFLYLLLLYFPLTPY